MCLTTSFKRCRLAQRPRKQMALNRIRRKAWQEPQPNRFHQSRAGSSSLRKIQHLGLYVVIRKEVQAGKKFYGSHDDNLMTELAKQADKAGADAIIKFHEWRAPSMFSWASAKAGGMAVKWTAEGKAGVAALKGQCWSPKGPERK